MSKQLSLLHEVMKDEDIDELTHQVELYHEYAKKKRNWENAFQKWCDEQSLDGMTALGICGYGDICDWCEDNSYGRPCVRALNAMCREKNISIDYENYDFKEIW